MARTSQKTMTNQTDNATVTTTTKVVDKDVIGKLYNGPFGIEYTGARYVPIFADPIDWNIGTAYEPLVVVTYQGNSYISRCYVPTGIDITDSHYWAKAADWNAQVEAYRKAVEEYKADVDSKLPQIEEAKNAAIKAIKEAEGEFVDLPDALKYAVKDGDVIAVFTDSTFGDSTDDITKEKHPGVLTYMQENSTATFINEVHPGWAVIQIRNYLRDEFDKTKIKDATHIIFAFGTNDWQGNQTALGANNPDNTEYSALIRQCLEILQEAAPKATLIVVTPPYVHSAQSNTYRNMNINNQGATVYLYCDILEHIAQEYNCGVMRLDRIMGINESNYKSQLTASPNDIYVHYTKETAAKIGAMILQGDIYNGGSTSHALDITPYEWNDDLINYYSFGVRSGSVINNAAKKIALVTPKLEEGVEYWFTFMGGPVKVSVGEQHIFDSIFHNVRQFPIVGKGQTETIYLENGKDDYNSPLISLTLTISRPNIFDVLSDRIRYTKQTINADDWNGTLVMMGEVSRISGSIKKFPENPIGINAKIVELRKADGTPLVFQGATYLTGWFQGQYEDNTAATFPIWLQSSSGVISIYTLTAPEQKVLKSGNFRLG